MSHAPTGVFLTGPMASLRWSACPLSPYLGRHATGSDSGEFGNQMPDEWLVRSKAVLTVNIRDKYVDAIEAIARRERVTTHGNVAYEIGAGATRRQCLRYALRHVVRHRQQHYRYDRYRGALNRALYPATVHRHGDGLLVHVDLGCGPGLFTWVISDLSLRWDVDVEQYGYDHSPEMIRLASEVWDAIGDATHCAWHQNIEDMLSAALAGGSSYSGLLVTCGHVLAQTSANEEAINGFASAVSDMTTEDCLVVAVDAKGASRAFREGCQGLVAAMEKLYLSVDVRYSGDQYFFADVKHR